MRKGRATILAVLALMVPVGATRAHACGVASHTFAVFLGWLDGKPVHLETELVRRDIRLRSKPWMELRWRGSARTIVAGTPAPPAAAPIWKGEVVNKELAPQIAGWVKGELSRLASDPGFVAAGMPDHRYCDFSRACGDLRLETQANGTLALRLGRSGGRGATIPLPRWYIRTVGEQTNVDDELAFRGEEPTPKAKRRATLKGVADSTSIARVLSYRAPDGSGTLVLALGFGDGTHGPDVEEAVWPPCGCAALTDCLPRAPTLHHGDHVEVVVPVPKHHPLGPVKPAAAVRLPSEDELRASEGQPPVTLRTDGIYTTDPVCSAERTWSRRHLLLFPDGHFGNEWGNISPASAANILGHGHYVYELGSYEVRGRRIVGNLKVQDRPREFLAFDGILTGDTIWARLRAGERAKARGARFTFVPIEVDKHKPLMHKHE